MTESLVRINVSLDAGTAETFAKIKQVDCFDKVVTNLRLYSRDGGGIDLKYILMDGINLGKQDLDGFLDIAKEVSAAVIISCDSRKCESALSGDEYNAIKYLVNECISHDISHSLSLGYIHYTDIDRLRNDGLLDLCLQN